MADNFRTDSDGYFLSDGPSRSGHTRFLKPKVRKQNSDYPMTPEKRLRARMTALRKRASDKGLDFDLDEEWLSEKLALTHCEVTGIEFSGSGVHMPWSLSIDRQDNTKGYTKENCKAVVWIYNNCKQTYSTGDMQKLAMALANNIQHP